MYRHFGDLWMYSLFNYIGAFATLISVLFYLKSKRNAMSLYSTYAIHYASQKNAVFGKTIEIILAIFESCLMVYLLNYGLLTFNKPFGDLVGTGANYFGGLFAVPVFWFVSCLLLRINPLKQFDIATLYLPVYLFFVKLACFFNGCCWGIPWEYGPYNHHYDHPGNQVPVQAIEAFWALLIFIFLLKYRKKAKTGTMFPMYMILYSATRFCSEFLRNDEENVFGILKTYHILCIIGVVIGLLMLLVVKLFGARLSEFFEKGHKKFDLKIEAERKEKIRQARKRPKARRGKKFR